MATKKPASTAKPSTKSAAKAPVKPAPKSAPAKAAVKAPVKPAAKAPAKAAAPVKPAPKASAKPVKAVESKPSPKAATGKKAAPVKAAVVAKVQAPKAGRPMKAASVPQPTPLLPEVVDPPAASAAPAPKARRAAVMAPISTGLSAHAATVLDAIQTGRAVELIFTDDNANPPRTFEPRQLIFDVFTRAWFAWGWDRRYNAERHHRLDLLSEVNPVDGPGRAAQGPYKDGTPVNQIGGWLGGEPIPVKATLMKQWLFAIKQAPAPFPEFHIEDAPDGKAAVSFTATDLRAIARWCMQFGDGIQVSEPQRLIDRIKQVGIAWGGKPVQAAAPAPAPKPAPVAAPRPEREHREHREHREPRREAKREHQDEPRHRSEHRDEPRRDREREAPKDESKGKPAKVEVRVERL